MPDEDKTNSENGDESFIQENGIVTSVTQPYVFVRYYCCPTQSFIATTEVVSANDLVAPTPGCHLLALPAEIRNEIYRHLFKDAKLGVSTVHKTSPFCGSFCDCAFPWHVLNTCRQLRLEATAVMLAATTLEVTSRVDKMVLLPEIYLSSISHAIFLDAKLLSLCPIKLDRFQALEVLELRNISVWCKYYDNAYLQSDHADECMFNLAMFNLGRISPSLVDICHDPSRRFKVLLGCQYVGNSVTHETIVSESIASCVEHTNIYKQVVIDVDTKKILHKTRGATITSRNEWSGFY